MGELIWSVGLVGILLEEVYDLGLKVEGIGGGFFSGFDTGLVVGVDVYKGGIEAYGAFVEGYEGSDGVGGDFVED